LIVLGVDPGSRFCGYGLIQVEKGKIVAAGGDVIRLSESAPLPDRLVTIHQELGKVIEEYHPDLASVEAIFYGKNVRSAFILGHVRGVVLMSLAQHALPIHEYAPKEVKLAVVGNGNASKQQVAYMVNRMLPLKEQKRRSDVTDALAIALCHYYRGMSGILRGIESVRLHQG
jgi:crossover junction endodeoxyribonuclease RuvC